jgi:hypothetical protein
MHNAVPGVLNDIGNGFGKFPDGAQSSGGITLRVKVYNQSA